MPLLPIHDKSRNGFGRHANRMQHARRVLHGAKGTCADTQGTWVCSHLITIPLHMALQVCEHLLGIFVIILNIPHFSWQLWTTRHPGCCTRDNRCWHCCRGTCGQNSRPLYTDCREDVAGFELARELAVRQ